MVVLEEDEEEEEEAEMTTAKLVCPAREWYWERTIRQGRVRCWSKFLEILGMTLWFGWAQL